MVGLYQQSVETVIGVSKKNYLHFVFIGSNLILKFHKKNILQYSKNYCKKINEKRISGSLTTKFVSLCIFCKNKKN